MGKIVAGLRGECLLRLKEDESHKVEEGARFEVEAAKPRRANQRHSHKVNQH
jgi:hypothetical protein